MKTFFIKQHEAKIRLVKERRNNLIPGCTPYREYTKQLVELEDELFKLETGGFLKKIILYLVIIAAVILMCWIVSNY